MRYIGKHKNSKLRQKQTEILCDIISKLNGKDEIESFLKNLMSQSELGYIAQRVNIMQLVLQENNYTDIKNDLGTTNGTINITKQLLMHANKQFCKLVLSGEPKPHKKEFVASDGHSWIEPHYPGAIKL